MEEYMQPKFLILEVSFECPHCNISHTVSLDYLKKRGYKIRCPLCKKGILIDKDDIEMK